MERANLQRVFTPNPIINIEDSDFELEGSIKIMLKIKKCIIILFYTDNTESMNITDVWQKVGNQGLAGVFGACNLRLNPKVSEAFNELNMTNTSLHWAALRSVPFILTYQNGYPIGFYNGERAVQPILDFSMTLACRSDYREPLNLYGGIQAEESIGIKNVEKYGDSNNPLRTQSSEYTTDKPVRTYGIDNKPIILPSPMVASGATGATGATVLLSPTDAKKKPMPSVTRAKSPLFSDLF